MLERRQTPYWENSDSELKQRRRITALAKKLEVGEELLKDIGNVDLRLYDEALRYGLDVGFYIHHGYDGAQVQQIACALNEGLDISYFGDVRLNSWQMGVIRSALKHKVDPSPYLTPLSGYTPEMKADAIGRIQMESHNARQGKETTNGVSVVETPDGRRGKVVKTMKSRFHENKTIALVVSNGVGRWLDTEGLVVVDTGLPLLV